MKMLLRIIAIAIALLGIATSSFAQLTLNATASATIVQTLTFTKLYDLDFGNLASNGTAGSCILTPMTGNNPTRTPIPGITLPAFHGTPRAASFTVTGVPAQYFTITIPQTALTITRVSGTETMTVDTYTTDQTSTGPGTWNEQLNALSGSATFYVGGTVHAPANPVPGVYTNVTGFPVTVNYQ